MIQKQALSLLLGGVVIAGVGAMVWMQFAGDRSATQSNPSYKTTTDSSATGNSNAPVPESVDDITASIVSESRVDATALEDEEAGALDEVNADSESVTNLETSYDQNSF